MLSLKVELSFPKIVVEYVFKNKYEKIEEVEMAF